VETDGNRLCHFSAAFRSTIVHPPKSDLLDVITSNDRAFSFWQSLLFGTSRCCMARPRPLSSREEGCEWPSQADELRLPCRSNEVCESISRNRWVVEVLDLSRLPASVPWVFSLLASGWSALRQRLSNLLTHLLAVLDQSASIIGGHLHSLRDRLCVCVDRFRNRARRRQPCRQVRPEIHLGSHANKPSIARLPIGIQNLLLQFDRSFRPGKRKALCRIFGVFCRHDFPPPLHSPRSVQRLWSRSTTVEFTPLCFGGPRRLPVLLLLQQATERRLFACAGPSRFWAIRQSVTITERAPGPEGATGSGKACSGAMAAWGRASASRHRAARLPVRFLSQPGQIGAGRLGIMQRSIGLRITRRRLDRVLIRLRIGDRRLAGFGGRRFRWCDRFFCHAGQPAPSMVGSHRGIDCARTQWKLKRRLTPGSVLHTIERHRRTRATLDTFKAVSLVLLVDWLNHREQHRPSAQTPQSVHHVVNFGFLNELVHRRTLRVSLKTARSFDSTTKTLRVPGVRHKAGETWAASFGEQLRAGTLSVRGSSAKLGLCSHSNYRCPYIVPRPGHTITSNPLGEPSTVFPPVG